jgi:hypothetical protein
LVLEQTRTIEREKWFETLDTALASKDAMISLQSLNTSAAADKAVSHVVVHMRASLSYNLSYYTVASDWVTGQVNKDEGMSCTLRAFEGMQF